MENDNSQTLRQRVEALAAKILSDEDENAIEALEQAHAAIRAGSMQTAHYDRQKSEAELRIDLCRAAGRFALYRWATNMRAQATGGAAR
jgi:hypothetical protein